MQTTKAQRQIRQLRVLELRVSGRSVRDVLATLQEASEPWMRVKSTRTIIQDERAILDMMRTEVKGDADRRRVLVHERYESLFLRWYPVAIGTDADAHKASEMCRRILTDIRALWGLDPNTPMVQINQTIEETTVVFADAKTTLREKLMKIRAAQSRNGDELPPPMLQDGSMEFDANGRNGSENDQPGGE